MNTTTDYDYVRFTPTDLNRLLDSTTEQKRELAMQILSDPTFSGELNRHARKNLNSDDPDEVTKGLETVFHVEYKIGCLGGWSNFMNDKYGSADDSDEDPLSDDTHLVGVHQPGHIVNLTDIQRVQRLTELTARVSELQQMDVNWPNRIRRGFRSNNERDLSAAVSKAEKFLETEHQEQLDLELIAESLEENPCWILQMKAVSLAAGITRLALKTHPLPNRRDHFQKLLDLTSYWEDKELLELWIDQADLMVNPPRNTSLLPPVHTRVGVGDIDWKEGVGTIGAANQQGSGVPSRGGTIPKSQKAQTKGHKGGGVKSRPTRRGASPVRK